MWKKRYIGLHIDDPEEIKTEDIPGFKEAGWTKKVYE